MMFVNKVALGSSKDFREFDMSLSEAPEGHHSTHGLRATDEIHSQFTVCNMFVGIIIKKQIVRLLLIKLTISVLYSIYLSLQLKR